VLNKRIQIGLLWAAMVLSLIASSGIASASQSWG
jgi:hypothetical protein